MAAKSKECGCSGKRSCRLCEQDALAVKESQSFGNVNADDNISKFILCLSCNDVQKYGTECTCIHDPKSSEESKNKIISGIYVVREFISEEEERRIVEEIDKTYWKSSQSGRRKQDYGPQVNFKRKKVKETYFNGLPAFSEFLIKRMCLTIPILTDFKAVEVCNLEYLPERGSSIDPHFDDFWLWGERLVTINLLSSSIMTMSHDNMKAEVDFEMPQRSLVIVSGPARYEWKHAIKRDNISSRRIAITFREFSKEFSCGGQNEILGKQIYETALSFSGSSVQVNMGLDEVVS